MKRRDLLKGLTMTAGGALCAAGPWDIAQGQPESESRPKLATPIRALARTDKGLRQPLQITLSNDGGSAIAITRLNGVEIDRRPVNGGANVFEVYLTPVSSARRVTVSVEVS